MHEPSTSGSRVSHPVFTACGVEFQIDDVIHDGLIRGVLEKRWGELLHGIACEELASQQGRNPDEDCLEELCNEFRYSRELVTTEETEQWMDRRGISEDAFSDYFCQRYWLAELGEKISRPETSVYQASPVQLDALRVHLLMSGEFDVLARRAAQRAAVCLGSEGREIAVDMEQFKKLAGGLMEKLSAIGLTLQERLLQWGRDADWMHRQFEREAVFQSFCEHATTREELEKLLNRLRLSLVSFDYEMIEVDGPDVLKEAQLSVTLDGLSPRELAQAHGFPHRRSRIFFELLPVSLQQSFLSVSPGEVVTRDEGPHQLFLIREKHEATMEDPVVRNYLRRRLLSELLNTIESREVRWHLPPCSQA